MSDIPVLQNALAWCHYRLRGGGRSAILQSVGFFFVIGALIMLAVRADPSSMQDILYGWMIALLALQIGILVLYGGSAVRNAIRKDVTTGMIASHRLMPISGSQAMIGYIVGACPQPVAVALANFLLGLLIAGPARINPGDWIAANALLGLFAVCSWIAVACASLISAKAAGGVIAAIVLISLSGGFLLTVVPAFTVICSPLVGSTIFGIVMKGAAWSRVLHLSIIGQLVVTAIFFIAGTRKYRRDDVLALGPLLGMAMLIIFVFVSVVGIRNWPALQPTISNFTGEMHHLQVIASMTTGLLLALLPVSAAAWLQEDYRRRRILNDPALGRRPVSTTALAVASGVLVALIAGFAPPSEADWMRRLAYTTVCLVAALVPLSYLLRLTYRVRAGAGFLVSLWIALTWVGPWLVSFGVLMAYGIDEAQRIPLAWERSEYVASFSPIGSLISIWTSSSTPYLVGVIFQVAVAALPALFYHTRRPPAGELYVPVVGGK